MSGNLTSKVTVIQKLSLISYAISWAGTSPVGLMVVEVSNDFAQASDGSVQVPGTWTALPLSSPPSVVNNSDNGFIDIDANAGYALRIRYVRTSGTGTINVIISAKVA